MHSSRASFVWAVSIAAVLILASCGSDGDAETSADDPASVTDATSDDVSDDDASDEPGAPAGGEHPIVSFVAHGEGEPNTFGPSCAMGIETTSSNLFRVTAPASWVQRGSSGGSGDSAIEFDVGDVRVTVDMAATSEETVLLDAQLGDEVGEADLDGTTPPIVEATIGESTGYAIADVVYMTRLPQQFGLEKAMTIVVSSPDPAVPSLADATAVLSSIRAERCAAIADAVVAMGAVPALAVPEFDDDPLGKTYPDGEQPTFDMAGAVDAWSVDQLAYLLPFPAPVDRCVAESLKVELPPEFPLGMLVVSAVGDQQDALVAIAADC